MKRVFTSSTDVIHLYAQRSQDEARCSNVFFEGDLIWSYGRHYLLGEFIDNGKAIVINDIGYSVTTSKHIHQLIQATRQYKQFFTSTCRGVEVVPKLQELFEKLPRARKKAQYINEINSIFEKYVEYLEYTKRNKRGNTYYRDARKIWKAVNSMDVEAILKKEKERQDKAKAKKIAKFMNYDVDYLYGMDVDYVRISRDKTQIETSQRVKVPIDDARLLYKMIKAGKDIKGHKIGCYTVISINGVLTIGCHKIKNFKEIGEQIL